MENKNIILIIIVFWILGLIIGFLSASVGVQHMYLDRMERIAVYCTNN